MNIYGKFRARSKDTSLKLLLPLINKSQRDIRSMSIMASSNVPLPDRCRPVAVPERALYMEMCSVRLGNARSTAATASRVSLAMYTHESGLATARAAVM